MDNRTSQEENWAGSHGNDYSLRNPQSIEEADALFLKEHGVSRAELNKEFLNDLPREMKILEVGSNVGLQLMFLQELGFKRLYGIEINRSSIEICKKNTNNIDIIQASALDIPFRDNYFDFVFTSGVLIHISPDDIKKAMQEIVRCSSKYIWGFEYFAENYTEVPYRGKSDLLWKANFSQLYLNSHPELKLQKEKKVGYSDDANIDAMFLLEKNA